MKLFLMLFKERNVSIETPVFWAMAQTLSPDFTVYVLPLLVVALVLPGLLVFELELELLNLSCCPG